jgi:hypothetical protein
VDYFLILGLNLKSMKIRVKHPGFKKVQSKIEGEGYSAKVAGAILASRTRNASEEAKAKNPALNKVKG